MEEFLKIKKYSFLPSTWDNEVFLNKHILGINREKNQTLEMLPIIQTALLNQTKKNNTNYQAPRIKRRSQKTSKSHKIK